MEKMDKTLIKKANWQLFLFGRFKIPVIGFCRPRVKELTNKMVRIYIPLRPRTRNHVGSLYLGVMTVGADLASGFLAFHLLKKLGIKASPVFKSMKAEYHKRAEAGVDFVCKQGGLIEEMIAEMQKTGERVTQTIVVEGYCQKELVASFQMELSFKESKKAN